MASNTQIGYFSSIVLKIICWQSSLNLLLRAKNRFSRALTKCVVDNKALCDKKQLEKLGKIKELFKCWEGLIKFVFYLLDYTSNFLKNDFVGMQPQISCRVP
jgi:hypothetical protein